MITVSGFQQDMAAQKRHREAKQREREALTAAHAAAQGEMDSACAGEGHCEAGPVPAGDARKAIPGLEAQPGPGTGREPGTISPQDFERGYIDPGHAAPSPQAGPPHDFPVPEGQIAAEDFTRGGLQQGHAAESPAVRDGGMPQHQLSPFAQVTGAGPGADAIRAHMARLSMTSPSLRSGR